MKWEYKTKRAKITYLTEWANDEGRNGWELVSAVVENYNHEPFDMTYVLVFKRPL